MQLNSSSDGETAEETQVQFVIGGAMKSGTSSVAHLLNQCADVYCFDRGYELHFFGKEKFYCKGTNWYNSHFTGRSEALIGEKSISYLSSAGAAQRICAYNRDMKVVFILRNPIDRAYSHYQYCVQMGTEFLPFAQALRVESLRRRLGGFFANNYSYQYRGLYYEQLMPYYKLFHSGQIHVMIFEDFKQRPEKTMSTLCAFLDVPFRRLVHKEEQVNATKIPRAILAPLPFTLYRKYLRHFLKPAQWIDDKVKWLEGKMYREGRYSPMPPVVRNRLRAYYQKPNACLAQLLGRDLSIWER